MDKKNPFAIKKPIVENIAKDRLFNRYLWVGLSDGMMPANELPDSYSNSYVLPENWALCFISAEHHHFVCPGVGAVFRPEWKPKGNIFGCGLLLDPNDKLAIFFTVNGKLMGQFSLPT
jgi:hypothetical protein